MRWKQGNRVFVDSHAICVTFSAPFLKYSLKLRRPAAELEWERWKSIDYKQKSHFLLRSSKIHFLRVNDKTCTRVNVYIGNREMQFEWFAYIYSTVWVTIRHGDKHSLLSRVVNLSTNCIWRISERGEQACTTAKCILSPSFRMPAPALPRYKWEKREIARCHMPIWSWLWIMYLSRLAFRSTSMHIDMKWRVFENDQARGDWFLSSIVETFEKMQFDKSWLK